MMNDESRLLYDALCYEQGHSRRTQHILKVYALAKLLAEREQLPAGQQQILQAAAIVHDLPIGYCKSHFQGDASQTRQRQAAPELIGPFLQAAGYVPSSMPEILELVLHHHDYDQPRGLLLQLLMEADLIVNCYECPPQPQQAQRIAAMFQTQTGKALLELCLQRNAPAEPPRSREEQMMQLTQQMLDFFQNDPKRAQHLLKVHRFAQLLGQMEHLDAETQFIAECAALVHDIGIRPAEEKYGRSDGRLQEQEGPAYARRMLQALDFAPAQIERICDLVGRHHTYTGIDGLDNQILVEADLLVNFYEDAWKPDAIRKTVERVFRTPAGKRLSRTIYGAGSTQEAAE